MTERSWLDRLLDVILESQDVVTRGIPLEAKLGSRGRKGRLVVTGQPSTVRYFRWTGQRLVEEPSSDGVRNTIQIHVDTLLDMALANIKPREAVAAGLVRIEGDLPESQGKTVYDREEFLQALDLLVGGLAKELRKLPRP